MSCSKSIIALFFILASIVNANAITLYSEDFSSDPGYTSTDPNKIYWDSQNKNYYTNVRDTTSAYYGYSPSFNTVSGTSFHLNYDMNPVNTGWGTYPALLLNQGPSSDLRDYELSISAVRSDSSYNLFNLRIGDKRTHSQTFSTNTWYNHDVIYDSQSQKVDWTVTNRETGAVFFRDTLNGVTVGSFNQFSLGLKGEPPWYGQNHPATTLFDNISLSTPDTNPGLPTDVMKDLREDVNNNRGVLKYYLSNGGDGGTFVSPDSLFDATKDTYVITHGWNGPGSAGDDITLNSENLDWVSDYARDITAEKGDVNVLAFDWTALANSTDFNPLTILHDSGIEGRYGAAAADSIKAFCDTGNPLFLASLSPAVRDAYFNQLEIDIKSKDWWVPNTQVNNMAGELAQQLTALYTESDLPSGGNIHLIGHSLGAAISAKAMNELSINELSNPLFNANLNRLTLLDAPEDLISKASGGAVYLDNTIRILDSDPHGITIENYFGFMPGGFGKSYHDIYNAGVQATHSGTLWSKDIKEWYKDTIDPSFYAMNHPTLTSPEGLGFSKENFQDEIEWFGELVVPEGYDPYLHFGDIQGGINHLPVFAERVADSFISKLNTYSPTGLGHIDTVALGQSLVTGSPIYGYQDYYIPEDVFGFRLDYLPTLWDETDMFTIAINDQIIYSFSGKYFTNDWISTDILDISSWAGEDVTFTFGFLSDSSGHTLIVGDKYFVSNNVEPVPEPATFILLGSGLAGLAFYRRKRK